MANKINNGTRFSISFDEWTSLQNRRYMNINIHENLEFFNIGLCRVFGSLPADKCVYMLNSKLMRFGLDLNKIVGLTTDGAAVMVKVGKLLKADH